MGDDSGLEVDALGGAPGVYSARYAGVSFQGPERSKANIEKLLKELHGVPETERTGRFICVIALLGPEGQTVYARGSCEGHIGFVIQGDQGFGYDPIFVPNGFACTMAQLVIAWTVGQPGVTFALCGARKPEQVRDNAGAGALALSGEDMERMRRDVEALGEPV